MQVDHVLIAVTDLDTAAQRFASTYGLRAVGGGRHPGWGTANRIVPLGEHYLELVTVVDHQEASANVFGRWVDTGATESGRLLGWAVRTDDLDAACRGNGLAPHSGSRVASDGRRIRWRTAGIDEAAADPSLPLFIEWAAGTELPGRMAGHGEMSITRIDVRGDRRRLASWLGEHDLPLRVAGGAGAIRGVTLSEPSRTIELRPGDR